MCARIVLGVPEILTLLLKIVDFGTNHNSRLIVRMSVLQGSYCAQDVPEGYPEPFVLFEMMCKTPQCTQGAQSRKTFCGRLLSKFDL